MTPRRMRWDKSLSATPGPLASLVGWLSRPFRQSKCRKCKRSIWLRDWGHTSKQIWVHMATGRAECPE